MPLTTRSKVAAIKTNEGGDADLMGGSTKQLKTEAGEGLHTAATEGKQNRYTNAPDEKARSVALEQHAHVARENIGLSVTPDSLLQQVNQREQKILQLEGNINTLQEQYTVDLEAKKALRNDLKTAKKQKADYVKAYTIERHLKVELKKQKKGLNAEIEALNERLKAQEGEHEQELAQHENEFAKVQKVLSDLTKRGSSNAWTDQTVQFELDRLRLEWNEWARTWVKESSDSLDSFSNISNSQLQQILEQGTPVQLLGQAKRHVLKALRALRPGPRILLIMLIATQICREVFESPFAFLKEWDTRGLTTSMEAIHAHGLRLDAKKAHEWRQLTMQLLNLPEVDGSRSEMGTDQLSVALTRERHYEKFAHGVTENVSILLNFQKGEGVALRFSQLLAIVSKAGEIASQLWSQKVHLSCTQVDPSSVFSGNSKEMKAHPCMGLDEESHEFDGRQIDITIEPAIIAWGNERGENYDQCRIWVPATVWIAPLPLVRGTGSDELGFQDTAGIKREHDVLEEDQSSQEGPPPKTLKQDMPEAESGSVGRLRSFSPAISGGDRACTQKETEHAASANMSISSFSSRFPSGDDGEKKGSKANFHSENEAKAHTAGKNRVPEVAADSHQSSFMEIHESIGKDDAIDKKQKCLQQVAADRGKGSARSRMTTRQSNQAASTNRVWTDKDKDFIDLTKR